MWTMMSDGHVDIARIPYIVTKYSYPRTYDKWNIHKTKTSYTVLAVTKLWKWSQGQWLYDRRELRNTVDLYTKYESSNSSTPEILSFANS